MALNKEIWAKRIIDKLFMSNEFMRALSPADEANILGNMIVHVPHAGDPSNVERNRGTLPANITRRTDTDKTYMINDYSIDPVAVSDLETAELSYNKMDSVINQNLGATLELVGSDVLYNIGATSDVVIEAPSAATFGYEDVKQMSLEFSKNKMPMTGRYAILTPQQIKYLKDELGEDAFNKQVADFKSGVIAQIDGWNIIERQYVVGSADGASLVLPEAFVDGTDKAGGIFLQKDATQYALGDVNVYHKEDVPEYYGDVFSAMLRAGSTAIRAEGARVMLEAQ